MTPVELSQSSKQALRALLSRLAFWVFLAWIAIVATIVALFVLFNRTANEDAKRAALAKSAATAQVSQCFNAVKNAPVIAGFFDAHETLIDNSILSNRAAIRASKPDDALLHVRQHAIARLMAAKQDAKQLRLLIKKTTPKKASCVALAARLHIATAPFTH